MWPTLSYVPKYLHKWPSWYYVLWEARSWFGSSAMVRWQADSFTASWVFQGGKLNFLRKWKAGSTVGMSRLLAKGSEWLTNGCTVTGLAAPCAEKVKCDGAKMEGRIVLPESLTGMAFSKDLFQWRNIRSDVISLHIPPHLYSDTGGMAWDCMCYKWQDIRILLNVTRCTVWMHRLYTCFRTWPLYILIHCVLYLNIDTYSVFYI